MKHVEQFVYWSEPDECWIAVFRGHEGRGTTEKNAIKALELELRDVPVRTRKRKWR